MTHRSPTEGHRFEAIRIVTFSILAAVGYGIVHDQVTAHLSVEYFTIGHPPVFGTDSPFLLAAGWGILATWWVGLALGIGLALAARSGRPPRLTIADLRRPILALMLASAALALVSGLAGATLAASGVVELPRHWDELLAPSKRLPFLAVAWAHSASYASGAIGGLLIIVRTARIRRRLRQSMQVQPGARPNDLGDLRR